MIGRKKELQRFKEAMESDQSEFIAVYGRRRVGKTFLIRQAFANRFTFAHIDDISDVPLEKVNRLIEQTQDYKKIKERQW